MWEAAAMQIKWVMKVPSSGTREWFSAEYTRVGFLIKGVGCTWFSVPVWAEGPCPPHLSLRSPLDSAVTITSFSALVPLFQHTGPSALSWPRNGHTLFSGLQASPPPQTLEPQIWESQTSLCKCRLCQNIVYMADADWFFSFPQMETQRLSGVVVGGITRNY